MFPPHTDRRRRNTWCSSLETQTVSMPVSSCRIENGNQKPLVRGGIQRKSLLLKLRWQIYSPVTPLSFKVFASSWKISTSLSRQDKLEPSMETSVRYKTQERMPLNLKHEQMPRQRFKKKCINQAWGCIQLEMAWTTRIRCEWQPEEGDKLLHRNKTRISDYTSVLWPRNCWSSLKHMRQLQVAYHPLVSLGLVILTTCSRRSPSLSWLDQQPWYEVLVAGSLCGDLFRSKMI